MENEHSSGTMDKIKGKFNQVAGDIKGDESQSLKGKAQSGMGEAKHVLGDVKDSLKGDKR